MTISDSIFKEVKLLKPKDKAILVDELLFQLDNPDLEIDKLWAVESEDRIAAYVQGEIKEVSLNEVLAKYNRSKDEN